MNFAITDIDAGDEICRVISFHVVINAIFMPSALHSVPILYFLVASGLLHCLFCSIHSLLYSIRLISSWRNSASGIYP